MPLLLLMLLLLPLLPLLLPTSLALPLVNHDDGAKGGGGWAATPTPETSSRRR
jgi:hypothetical protein